MEDEISLYQPLDRETGEIRLLTVKLLEPEASNEALIELDLYHVPLDQAKQTYIALSYTWGDPKTSKTIRLNGQDLQVRDNLYDFLVRYRECMTDREHGRDLFETVPLSDFYKDAETLGFFKENELKHSEMGEPLYPHNMPIWIDALCLDQGNIPELNDNVPRMKDIYEQAQSAIIWLGNETETTREAMVFLQQTRTEFGLDRQTNMIRGMLGGATGLDRSRLGPAPKLEEWKAVTELFDHPYWKRMWVVQELAYTFRAASIWCGRRQMHAYSLAKVQRAYFGDELGDTGMRHYTHPRYDRANSVPTCLSRGGPWPIEIIYDLAEKPHGLAGSDAKSTREIMSMIRTRKASVPHDMIYALYKLIVRDPQYPLIVDYNRTVAQVFCDYMEYELTTSRSLQIWQMLTEKKSNIEGLPSWAVDWTNQDENHNPIHLKTASSPRGPKEWQAGPGLTVVNFAGGRAPTELVPAQPDVTCAAGTTIANVRFIEPCRKIAVTGYMIGTIDSRGGEFKMVKHPDDEDEAFWEDIDDAASYLREISGEKAKKVFQVGSCLLFDDRVEMSSPQHEGDIKIYAEHLLDIALACRIASPVFDVHFKEAIDSLILKCYDESVVDEIPKRDLRNGAAVHQEFTRKIRRNFWDRSWIVNKRFNALGLAPAGTREGDTLFVPHGCPFVMVFHDEGDGTFSVVGTCWLYGFMHGEAVKMHTDGIIEEKEVVLV